MSRPRLRRRRTISRGLGPSGSCNLVPPIVDETCEETVANACGCCYSYSDRSNVSRCSFAKAWLLNCGGFGCKVCCLLWPSPFKDCIASDVVDLSSGCGEKLGKVTVRAWRFVEKRQDEFNVVENVNTSLILNPDRDYFPFFIYRWSNRAECHC